MMNDKRARARAHTHTHTQRISDKFIDVKKINLKKGEILATPFYPTQKNPFFSYGKASGHKKKLLMTALQNSWSGKWLRSCDIM
jgi:hypothetical protein